MTFGLATSAEGMQVQPDSNEVHVAHTAHLPMEVLMHVLEIALAVVLVVLASAGAFYRTSTTCSNGDSSDIWLDKMPKWVIRTSEMASVVPMPMAFLALFLLIKAWVPQG